MGIRERIKEILIRRCERKYQKALAAKEMSYAEWLPGYGAELPGKAVEENRQYQLLYFAEGRLAEQAEERIAAYMEAHPEVLLIYGDEDEWEEKETCPGNPRFQPDWSPDTFLSRGELGGLVAVRKEWYEKLAEADREPAAMVRLAGGFTRSCRSIAHLPAVLFHRTGEEEQNSFKRRDIVPKDEQSVDGQFADRLPLVSVIIPSKDHPQILQQCLTSLYAATEGYPYEVIIVDNGSTQENREKITSLIAQAPVSVSYLYEPMEFHFSGMCNLGAQQAKGELLLFLNDDVEMRCQGFLQKMAQKALKPYVGAVGMKLYYPDSQRMQHDGIVNLPMGPVHKLQFLEDTQEYYDGYNTQDRNVLAVTGACLMLTREKWLAVGGMAEELPVAFNDVDLCFTLWKQGYHNVVLNSVYAWHHESLSRGEDESPAKLKRLLNEKDKLYRRHPALAEGADPYYSYGLNRDGLDTGIRPAYITAKNRQQISAPAEKQISLEQYRRDDCLLLRVERCEEVCIQGYSVVLGDNNACYDKALLLWKLEGADAWEPEGQIACYVAALNGQYRPELVENMADQRNVGLCGFWWQAQQGSLAPGSYRLGVTAVSRVGGTRLINWSNRVLEV